MNDHITPIHDLAHLGREINRALDVRAIAKALGAASVTPMITLTVCYDVRDDSGNVHPNSVRMEFLRISPELLREWIVKTLTQREMALGK